MINAFRQLLLDHFVLQPSRGWIDHDHQERLVIDHGLDSDECFAQRPNFPDRSLDVPAELVIIKFPGIKGRAERASPWPAGLVGRDVLQLSWNPPGYGRTTGRASISNIARRASVFVRLVIEHLQLQHTPIWLYGNSMGCATTGAVAACSNTLCPGNVCGVVLRNPPPLVEVIKQQAKDHVLGRWADSIADSLPPEMNLLRTARQIQLPMLVVQSELDELVPTTLQDKVVSAWAGPTQRVVIPAADHSGTLTDEQDPLLAPAVDWLVEHSLSMAKLNGILSPR
ncbi:Alpha/beta hydrolase family protein [Stieleria bergensis]|uniref:Alpha/beta hydrolase family protein n=1 Tax=Stieleria bergensis TaxID=2528025 RepID=A0A517SNK3_9BACT|nr:Alpha/beta hydrolase family protein [Planctomycetes bacterium SV_7m_r]